MYFVNGIRRTEHLILKKPKQIKKICNTIKENYLKKKFGRDIGRIN